MKSKHGTTYSASGTEPLRSNEKKLTSAAPASPGDKGKPTGGTENRGAKTIVLSAKAAKMAKGGADRRPPAVAKFSGRVK